MTNVHMFIEAAAQISHILTCYMSPLTQRHSVKVVCSWLFLKLGNKVGCTLIQSGYKNTYWQTATGSYSFSRIMTQAQGAAYSMAQGMQHTALCILYCMSCTTSLARADINVAQSKTSIVPIRYSTSVHSHSKWKFCSCFVLPNIAAYYKYYCSKCAIYHSHDPKRKI